MKKVLGKFVIIMMCTVIVNLSGCMGKNYNDTASDLLKAISGDVLLRMGDDSEVRIITIDVSDFADYPIDDFTEWVTAKYGNDKCFVLVLEDGENPFEDDSDITSLLAEHGYEEDTKWDWTNFYFERLDEEDSLSNREKIETHILYSTGDVEGWKLNVVYKNDQWEIKDTNLTYHS